MALLELNGVEKRFRGLPAVADVSFSVDEGEILALVGPNGAGKTTLLKAICGIQAPTGGTILFNGQNITGFKPHRARHAGVAIVLQTPRPFETTAAALEVGLATSLPSGGEDSAELRGNSA